MKDGRKSGKREEKKDRKEERKDVSSAVEKLVKQDLKWFLFSWPGHFRSGRSEQTWEMVKLVSERFHQIIWQDLLTQRQRNRWNNCRGDQAGKIILDANSTLNLKLYVNAYCTMHPLPVSNPSHVMSKGKIKVVVRVLTIISKWQRWKFDVVILPQNLLVTLYARSCPNLYGLVLVAWS